MIKKVSFATYNKEMTIFDLFHLISEYGDNVNRYFCILVRNATEIDIDLKGVTYGFYYKETPHMEILFICFCHVNDKKNSDHISIP